MLILLAFGNTKQLPLLSSGVVSAFYITSCHQFSCDNVQRVHGCQQGTLINVCDSLTEVVHQQCCTVTLMDMFYKPTNAP